MKQKPYRQVFWSLLYLVISYLFQRKEKNQKKLFQKQLQLIFHRDYNL